MIQYSLRAEIDCKQAVQSIAFSPDGQFVAIGVPDGTKIYQAEKGRLFLRVYMLSSALCLGWDPSGSLFCGCRSGYLAVISINTVFKTVKAIFSHVSQSPLTLVAIHPRGTFMALAEGRAISIWKHRPNPRTGSLPWDFQRVFDGPKTDIDGKADVVTSISWMDSSQSLLVASFSNEGIRVYGMQTQDPVSSIPTRVSYGCLSPCGHYFANSLPRCIKIVEMNSSVDLKVLYHENPVPEIKPVVWVHGGGFLLWAGQGKAILWHIDTKQQRIVELPETMSQQHVTHVAASYSIRNEIQYFQIALVSDRSQLTIWSAKRQKVQENNLLSRTIAMWGLLTPVALVIIWFYIF